MVNAIYSSLFIISFIMLIVLVAAFRNRLPVYYVMMYMSILVSNYGYMQIVAARDINAAVYANQTVYLGSSFSPFFLLMCLVDLCKIKLKRIYQVIFLVWGSLIFLLTSSLGSVDWYYKSIEFEINNGIGKLVKEYGPLHFIYPLYMITVIAIGIVFIIRAVIRKKEVSYNTSILLLSAMVMIVLAYALERILKLDFTILPFAFVIAQFATLILLKRISLFSVAEIYMDSVVESLDDGFVLCDSKGRYLGGDEAAKTWFPELKELRVEGVIKKEETKFLQQIGKWIRNEDDAKIVYFERENMIIAAAHTILRERGKKIIHCIYLRDDTKQQKYTKLVEQYNENLAKDVDIKTEKIRNIQDDIIISMASIVENRDNNTGGHIARTSDVVKIFVKHLQEKNIYPVLTEEIARCIIKAAPLHDFGKIAIEDKILNKAGKFEPDEYEKMKTHSAKGAVIVERILQNSDDEEFKKIAVNVAHYHHEKWDGKGYPTGIAGEKIPFEARVMALADVFDALVSKRVYKEKMSYEKAFGIIEESCGTHFDPKLCEEFLHCKEELIELYNGYGD